MKNYPQDCVHCFPLLKSQDTSKIQLHNTLKRKYKYFPFSTVPVKSGLTQSKKKSETDMEKQTTSHFLILVISSF